LVEEVNFIENNTSQLAQHASEKLIGETLCRAQAKLSGIQPKSEKASLILQTPDLNEMDDSLESTNVKHMENSSSNQSIKTGVIHILI